MLVLQESGDPSAVLWYEEIQSTVDVANKHASDGNNSKSTYTSTM